MVDQPSVAVTDPDWQAASDDVRQAIQAAWRNGMPPLASALYARWWQLESWLRTLVYVELRAKFVSEWVLHLPEKSEQRQQGDEAFQYMATPDLQNILAYTDASVLFSLTLDHWDLFKEVLLPKNIWAGRIEEFRAIRNRIGHCRRPHADDLVRLEQTLRDLNGGAFKAVSAFNKQGTASEEWTDVITDEWVRERNADTGLIKHAQRQYDTIFKLKWSRRPWATKLPIHQKTINGVSGYIWHAFWYFRGGRSFDLEKFWKEIDYWRAPILLVCADYPSSISVSFSVMEKPEDVNDAIGRCFDAALYSLGRGARSDANLWRERYNEIDPRVLVFSPWTLVDESMHGISMFGA
jgi:hypothetical protein